MVTNPTISFISTLLFLSIFLVPFGLFAQGIKGKVSDQEGNPLPFASIIFPETGHGIASNIEGEYALQLHPGKHRIRFQYLGYTPLDTTVQVGSSYIILNVVMAPEIVELREATVGGKGEDPAYTIMRRAIAKAKYHSMQVDEYHAMVYLKGSGRLLKVPGLFRKRITKALAEEGIDSTVAFTQESVSKLHYLRPDQYRDTVVSIHTTGNDNNTSPMSFIYSSFYEPTVVNGVSPLAPDAFNHYRFEYLGFIDDGDHTVNKIKVIPKGKGDQVFDGVIYIVDGTWSIHSLDLTTYIWGIRFDMQQRFAPLMPEVWLPVHEIYDVSGSVFGFAFEYRYFARLSDYKIRLNPDLEVPLIVLDAKVETDDARMSDEKWEKESFDNGLAKLSPGEELSAKQLRKMMKEYEKQEIEALPESDTIQLTNSSEQYIDSTAYQKDSAYWQTVRPMPLTSYEVRGYERQDSIAAIPPEPGEEDDESEQDTVSVMMSEDGLVANVKRREKFSFTHLLTGGRYDISDQLFLRLKALVQTANYNTVDGFYGGYQVLIGNKVDQKLNWEAGPSIRYNIARESFNYDGIIRLYGKKWDLQLSGGKQTRQYNYDFPLATWANTAYTLLANRNYLKEYEQTFGGVHFEQSFKGGISVAIDGEYAERDRLINHTDIVFIDDKKLLFTSNDPVHVEGGPAVFDNHTAMITDVSLMLKPFWRYRVNKGVKRKDYSRSPSLELRYRKGWGEDNHPFDLVAATFKSKVRIGAGSLLSVNTSAGKFIGEEKPKYFHDFFHFPGNRLIATPLNPVSAFRMLDYYTYSTNQEYFYGLFNYQFRRFGLTQFDYFRRQGIRENVIFNVLLTPSSEQYAEIGYSINYILRFMRIEFVTSWQDYMYQDFAVRFGIATDFQSIFGF
jgi:hypothetical protein